MKVIDIDSRKPVLRTEYVTEQYDLEIAYLEALQGLRNVRASVHESRKLLNDDELEELRRRLRVAGEDWLADSII